MLYVPSPVTSEVTSTSYHALVETAPTVASSALSLAGAVFQVTLLSLQELFGTRRSWPPSLAGLVQ